jgi:DNA-binding NtrC family response regulator
MNAPRIAVVDDEPRMGKVLGMVLGRDGHDVDVFAGGAELVAALSERAYDAVVTDLKMPGMTGMDVLAHVQEHAPGTPVVVVTAHGTVDVAVDAMKQGAFDFIQKPFDNARCRAIVRRALEVTRLERENRYLRAEVSRRHHPDGIIALSEPMRRVLELTRRAARSPMNVLVHGESGTGKELVARAVHYYSERVGEPFVAVNCSALATGLLESELFGHVKGAFTGASAPRDGLFVSAGRGTVFLDEIGEVDAAFQAKLLRVLQLQEVVPVGTHAPVRFHARVVAATNRDLRAEVDAGRFREDLYYRLSVIPLELPPLRERPEEVLPLARHFLARAAGRMGVTRTGWAPEVEAYLTGHDWPGNVRELENLIERAVALSLGEVLELEDLMLDVARAPSPVGALGEGTLDEVVAAVTARHVRATLARCEGRRQEAADALGVDRTTLYRLMKRHAIE